jgi:hypothetical protein
MMVAVSLVVILKIYLDWFIAKKKGAYALGIGKLFTHGIYGNAGYAGYL